MRISPGRHQSLLYSMAGTGAIASPPEDRHGRSQNDLSLSQHMQNTWGNTYTSLEISVKPFFDTI
jgi:hypothetical protein